MKNCCFLIIFCFVGCMSFKPSAAENTPCALRATEMGYVCVCNATYCDFMEMEYPANVNDFTITSSSKGGLMFKTNRGKFSDFAIIIEDYGQEIPTLMSQLVRIDVDRSTKFQEILGFGGAVTGSSSYILGLLPEGLQNGIYKSYYSQEGIDFNLLRMPIGGSDFDFEPWAYNENPENDKELSNFTDLDPRDEQKLEQLNALRAITGKDDIKVMLCAWSPPKWMKTNGEWTGASALKQEYYQTWANYHLRMVELWENYGLPIWSIAAGNEPLNGNFRAGLSPILNLGWTPDDQATWVADYLGPTVRESEFSDLQLFSNDELRPRYPDWFIEMNETRPKSMEYLDGLSVHWYLFADSNENLLDEAHELFPDKQFLNTESSLRGTPMLGSWENGESYAQIFFKDLRHSIQGFIDWNIVLNEKGGPNYAQNYVDAPILANETSRDEVYKQPIFYTIGHLSKFIPVGSVRVKADISNENMDAVAFERPDKRISVIFYNSGNDTVDVILADRGRGELIISIPQRSIHSIVYN